MIALKRAYEPARGDDGQRFLVERLWPRGVKKAALRISGWLKRRRAQHRTAEMVQPRPGQMGRVSPPLLCGT